MNSARRIELASNEPNATEWVARALALGPDITAAANEIESTSQIPASLLAKMHSAELYRLMLPKSIGGFEAAPMTFIEVMEALARFDASTAWTVGQGSGCSLAAAYLAPEVAREIFGPSDSVLAWGAPNPNGRAIPVPGGYKVTGRWHFASGNRHSRWMGGHCMIYEADGSVRLTPDGRKGDYTFLFKRSDAIVENDWKVMGLRGTGSDSYSVTDLFVPESHTMVRECEPQKREKGPLYQFTFMHAYGFGIAGAALGVAGAMLEDLKEFAKTRTKKASSIAMRDSTAIQSEIAKAQAKLWSSRAFLLDAVAKLYRTAEAGQPFEMDDRVRARLAIVWTAQQAREVAEFAFLAPGTDSIFEVNPFERRFRDMHALTQQVNAQLSVYDIVGQCLLGTPVKSPMI